jgi:hypothetical protein
MALNYLGINKKHENIICKLYDITVDEPLLRDKIFNILDQNQKLISWKKQQKSLKILIIWKLERF